MSSSKTKTGQARSAAKQNDGAAPMQPALVPSTPAAQAAQHAVPATLAALFCYRFPALVADPVAEMATALPIVAALQAGYALVCLPLAGSQRARAPRKPRPGEKKKAGEGAGPNYAVVRLDPPSPRSLSLPIVSPSRSPSASTADS